MEHKTEQDRIREVMEARKTMKKFAKVSCIGGSVVILGVSILLAGLLPSVIVLALEVGTYFFIMHSFKASDEADLKRIAELDADPTKGQGLAAKGMFGANSDLIQEVQANLSKLAASAAKMGEDSRDKTLAAINDLKQDVTSRSQKLKEVRKIMAGIDESKATETELQLLNSLKEQEKGIVEAIDNIGKQARELKVTLDSSLAAGDAGDNQKVNDALRAIKVETSVNAELKNI